ncbi:MAG TPA: hypothetical protein VLT36_12320 [Candidatus Dormibacteraeota bacterium]|nr:hypothetical protein [Candidatus Dormibacteraeota bacterium]
MKKCSYCGKDYPDAVERCEIDAETLVEVGLNEKPLPLPYKGSPPPKLEAPPRPTVLDLSEIGNAFELREGFSRPNWKLIRQLIKNDISPESHSQAWTDAAFQWAEQIRADLGGEYNLLWSDQFILVTALEQEKARSLLQFSERTLDHINESLQDAAWRSGLGKHLLFLFVDLDDYYQYIADFYRDGVYPTTSGVLLGRGYVHIAMPAGEGRQIRRVLTHELAHNVVVHLPLPAWLNEGVAQTFERTAIDRPEPFLDHDLRDRHLAFWNNANIQKFWAGTSFYDPGDSNELSYNLAEIMVNLLNPKPSNFADFLKAARPEDAGQTASLDCLGADLGSVMGTFLGEGNWRPNRKAIAECWAARKKKN